VTTALLSTEQGRAAIRDFLSAADISIADVQAVPRKGLRAQWVMNAGGIQATQEEHEVLLPVFEHTTPHGSAKFELHDESEGTQRLFGLIAPVLDCLRDGRVLVVDELDSSLHPLLVRRLIAMFQTPELNPHGAQLIFSTHDTSLLDHSLFRRDQIWFTEKDVDQATRLYPLTDFSPRKQEAWERGYLAGRYGAVPFFGDLPGLAKAETH
jgi:AAA15 family ATPase/GTPase